MLKQTTAQEVQEAIKASNVTVVKFGAPWCRPCKTLDSVLESVDYTILKVDIDTEPRLAEEYGVMSIPAMIFFKDGVAQHKFLGIVSEDQVTEKIDELS